MEDKNAGRRRLYADPVLCLGCRTCELRCAVERGSVSKNLHEAVREDILPRPRVYVQWDGECSYPLQCRHCENPRCLEICPSGALRRDGESGLVIHEADRCIGCYMCVMVCPLGLIAAATEKRAADKCDRCLHREEPGCVAACPTGALTLLTEEEIRLRQRSRRAAAPAMEITEQGGNIHA